LKGNLDLMVLQTLEVMGNRRAKFYSITRRGSRRLASSAQNWEQLSIVMGRFLAAKKGPSDE